MVKDLADGSRALALFNRDGSREAVIQLNWSEIGAEGPLEVFDIWRQAGVGTFREGISVRLSPSKP